MGFGGGGSGSFVLPNHTHTNVLADGGELEELVSLIDGSTFKTWLDAAIAAKLVPWEIIEDWIEADATGTTKTFNFTAVDFDDYSELVLIIDGAVTASLELQMQVNGLTAANYISTGRHITTGTEVLTSDVSTTQYVIAHAATLATGDYAWSSQTKILLTKSGAYDRPLFRSEVTANGRDERSSGVYAVSGAASDISSITVKVSASSWKQYTRMTLYKVRRA